MASRPHKKSTGLRCSGTSFYFFLCTCYTLTSSLRLIQSYSLPRLSFPQLFLEPRDAFYLVLGRHRMLSERWCPCFTRLRQAIALGYVQSRDKFFAP
ncbi:hypothetical protein F5Y12DRAFT_742060 [Xylaria sp. FL1777]|nr:hypothetical protein F5Y12DRAFT_742060 [Xylaria sp. FL1777]